MSVVNQEVLFNIVSTQRPNTALQTDIPGWAILRDGDSYKPLPVYRIHPLQGCG